MSIWNSNLVMTSSVGGAKGCSDHRLCEPPAYTAQSLTLYQHRANNPCIVGWLTLRVSSNTQTTPERESPELNVA